MGARRSAANVIPEPTGDVQSFRAAQPEGVFQGLPENQRIVIGRGSYGEVWIHGPTATDVLQTSGLTVARSIRAVGAAPTEPYLQMKGTDHIRVSQLAAFAKEPPEHPVHGSQSEVEVRRKYELLRVDDAVGVGRAIRECTDRLQPPVLADVFHVQLERGADFIAEEFYPVGNETV